MTISSRSPARTLRANLFCDAILRGVVRLDAAALLTDYCDAGGDPAALFSQVQQLVRAQEDVGRSE